MLKKYLEQNSQFEQLTVVWELHTSTDIANRLKSSATYHAQPTGLLVIFGPLRSFSNRMA